MQGCKGCTDARPINQYDGCRAGHVIGQSGLHEYEGHGYMTCQAKRYVGADARPVAIYLGRIETSDGHEAWVELADEDRKYWPDTIRSVYVQPH